MRKTLAIVLTLVTIISTLFLNVTTFAANTIDYYDETGNRITINGMYYNSQGHPMYNSSCYYIDANGNTVYVGGCRAYYYNADGNLVPGNYYYDATGKSVTRPTSYPGGWGCGAFYYDTQGNTVNGNYYYDDFGSLVEPPATTTPIYRGRGCCWR